MHDGGCGDDREGNQAADGAGEQDTSEGERAAREEQKGYLIDSFMDKLSIAA